MTLDPGFGRLDSCSRCWPSLLDMLAEEGLDLRPFADSPVLHLVVEPPEGLTRLFRA